MNDKLDHLPEWLNRGIVDLFPSENTESNDQNLSFRLTEALTTKNPLRVKLGIDPTAADIHLGHSILFRKLRAFQDAGHTAVLIIGDFTAQIGDPTGKSKTRVQLSQDQVESNAATYLDQLGYGKSRDQSILDFETPNRLEIRRNSEWLSNLDLVEVVNLLSAATVGQMLAKEEFGNRYKEGTPISLHEFLYPLLQGYDSFAISSDIELGGTDQKFNVAMGRDIQRIFKKKPQFGLLLPILNGIDGEQKMSKSLGNTVSLKEDALSMYSKLEKIPDTLVDSYLRLLTNLDVTKLVNSPRELQKLMALEITSNFHGRKAAESAQLAAQKLVKGDRDSLLEIPLLSLASVNFPAKAFYLLSAVNLCVSSSEARRQIQGGGVRLDGQKITDPNTVFEDKKLLIGKVLQLGKKTFRRLAD
ncbi:tyrosine--tRNA ligase [Prochlorococcus sp. MIT 1223]|uniref:tyrosine--tRNA ligase n=1 Tax=Prochlorococcus sp. MIT 1223 TaxID=3096217 RepID=UPI002A765AE3|nr:tyrosine--tRNA ligase [Prochlorococcus sp. MIT 1223]